MSGTLLFFRVLKNIQKCILFLVCKSESTHFLISYMHGCAHCPMPCGAAVILSFLTMIWNTASLSAMFFYITKATGVIFTGGRGASPSAKKQSFTAIRGHRAHYASGHGWKKKKHCSHQWKYPGQYEDMDFTIHDIISAQAPFCPDF